jgi:hypothetical protein
MAADTMPAPRPLRLALEAGPVRIDPPQRDLRTNALPRRGPADPGSPAALRQQAVEGLLAQPEPTDGVAAADSSPFRFKRQGNVGRDFGRGYRDMCDNVSRKVWDDPNGKRVKFDVGGKPGIGFEIPIH